MFKINNVTIPTPSTYNISVLDISKAERNAKGEMILEIIATKRKLELSYNYLSNSDLSTLLSRFTGNTFFTVHYPDTVTGAEKSGTFYVSDRKSEAIDYQNGVPRWKGISFSLVEK